MNTARPTQEVAAKRLQPIAIGDDLIGAKTRTETTNYA